MKPWLKRLLKTELAGRLIGWGLAHMDFLLPVERLRETETLLAFWHPKPVYPFHVILIPRQDIRSFADLAPADPFLADLVAAVQSLVEEFHLKAYRLIVNGGENQEFPHLHFHLVSDARADERPPLREN